MKKIFISALLTTTLFACSNDNQLENSNSSNDSETIVKSRSDEFNTIFQDYVQSSEYIAYDEALVEFTSLLNYQGSLIDINSMEKLEIYVDNNLSQTNFVSYSQFNSKRINLLNLKSTLIGTPSYIRFKDLVLDTNLTLLEGYFGEWFGSNKTANADCEQDYKDCNDAVTGQYAADMKETLGLQKNGEINGSEANNRNVVSEVALKVGRENCDNTFKDCITA